MRRQHITPRRSVATLSITTHNPLPSGIAGSLYSLTFTASGGQGNYRWRLLADYQSTGLTINALTGSLSGIPAVTGTGLILIAVTDSGGASVQQQFAVTFSAAPILTITTTSIPNATVGTAYSATVNAIAGATPYTWSISSDTPDTGSWLSINSSTGVLSGTPTTAETESLVVKVTDSVSHTASQPLSFTVNAASGGQTLKSFLQAQVGTKYVVAQTGNIYSNPNAGSQFTGLIPVSGTTYPAVVNLFTASAPNGGPNAAGWFGPYQPDVVSHVNANGIMQFTFTPDNPAGSGTTGPSGGNGDGGSDITDNPNPTSAGNPTSSSVIFNVANIINGSSITYNTFQTRFFAYIDWCCVNVYSKIKDSSGNSRPWIFCPPGEFNDSAQWWNCIDNGDGNPTLFTLAQYALLCKLIIWRMVKINGLSGFLVCLEPGLEFPSGVTAGAIKTVATALGPDSIFPQGYVDAIGVDINSIKDLSPTNGGASTYAALQSTGLLNLGFLSVGWDFDNSSTDNYNNIWLPMISAYPDMSMYTFFCQKAALTAGTNANLICAASNAITRADMPALTLAGGIAGN